ncbi:ROK family protein [Microlunatus soli]|uniref:Glucokinase n=1 Tax=Microlunatus soli TaxID=630515 RepID=A0A1H1U5E3_9ACTN|nr:ROK family protein [Microlunatus soli]SDS67587.1 glucokinase [Microlunatus soli]
MIALGIDIGGTKIAAGLVRSDGRILDRTTVPTPAREGSSAILDVACTTAESLLDRSPDRVVGCGIGSAGVIDPDSGTVSSATSSLADWVGTDLRGGVRRRLGLPVRVLNDVHAHAVAEARLGAGAGANRMLLLALGTGIGGALVDAGRVDRGRHGAAGHFGHLPVAEAAGLPCPCGRSGHLEAVASGPAILARCRDRLGDGPELTDTRDVFAAAAAGDIAARTVLDEAATAIGAATAGLINALDPDLVVLAGGLAFADRSWTDRIVDQARSGMIPVVEQCPIVPSQLDVGSAMVGAALWCLSGEEVQ